MSATNNNDDTLEPWTLHLLIDNGPSFDAPPTTTQRPWVARKTPSHSSSNTNSSASQQHHHHCGVEYRTSSTGSVSTIDPDDALFHGIFDNHQDEELFDEVVAPAIERLGEGFSSTIVIFGQMTSGKHRMVIGTPDAPGLLPKLCETVMLTIGRGAKAPPPVSSSPPTSPSSARDPNSKKPSSDNANGDDDVDGSEPPKGHSSSNNGQAGNEPAAPSADSSSASAPPPVLVATSFVAITNGHLVDLCDPTSEQVSLSLSVPGVIQGARERYAETSDDALDTLDEGLENERQLLTSERLVTGTFSKIFTIAYSNGVVVGHLNLVLASNTDAAANQGFYRALVGISNLQQAGEVIPVDLVAEHPLSLFLFPALTLGNVEAIAVLFCSSDRSQAEAQAIIGDLAPTLKALRTRPKCRNTPEDLAEWNQVRASAPRASGIMSAGDLSDEDQTPLPYGWERQTTDDGRHYYVDHLNKTTTWDDPRKVAEPQTSSVPLGRVVFRDPEAPVYRQATPPATPAPVALAVYSPTLNPTMMVPSEDINHVGELPPHGFAEDPYEKQPRSPSPVIPVTVTEAFAAFLARPDHLPELRPIPPRTLAAEEADIEELLKEYEETIRSALDAQAAVKAIREELGKEVTLRISIENQYEAQVAQLRDRVQFLEKKERDRGEDMIKTAGAPGISGSSTAERLVIRQLRARLEQSEARVAELETVIERYRKETADGLPLSPLLTTTTAVSSSVTGVEGSTSEVPSSSSTSLQQPPHSLSMPQQPPTPTSPEILRVESEAVTAASRMIYEFEEALRITGSNVKRLVAVAMASMGPTAAASNGSTPTTAVNGGTQSSPSKSSTTSSAPAVASGKDHRGTSKLTPNATSNNSSDRKQLVESSSSNNNHTAVVPKKPLEMLIAIESAVEQLARSVTDFRTKTDAETKQTVAAAVHAKKEHYTKMHTQLMTAFCSKQEEMIRKMHADYSADLERTRGYYEGLLQQQRAQGAAGEGVMSVAAAAVGTGFLGGFPRLSSVDPRTPPQRPSGGAVGSHHAFSDI